MILSTLPFLSGIVGRKPLGGQLISLCPLPRQLKLLLLDRILLHPSMMFQIYRRRADREGDTKNTHLNPIEKVECTPFGLLLPRPKQHMRSKTLASVFASGWTRQTDGTHQWLKRCTLRRSLNMVLNM